MTRISGFAVTIKLFIPASAREPQSMALAISAIDAACEALRKDGFQMVTHESRFMLSRALPDEPKAAEALVGWSEPTSAVENKPTMDRMPEIPLAQRR